MVAVRELAAMLAFLLMLSIIVYGGLNLAERNLSELLAREWRHEAFSIAAEPRGALLVTFAAGTVQIGSSEFQALIKRWWDSFPERFRLIFMGKILDKTPGGWYFYSKVSTRHC